MSSLRVLHPCDESWSEMPGTDRVRHCDRCDKRVHDVRHLSEREIRGYVRLHGSSLCVRMLAVSVIAATTAACESPKPAPAVPGPTVALVTSSVDAGLAEVTRDADQDGIADAKDACPDVPGSPSADEKKNGCPAFVTIEKMGELQILQRVHFQKSKTTIQVESDPIINDTIAAMKANPQITRIEVQGYASSDEGSAQNLSEKRAAAVVAKMVAAGIDPKRVVAKGYGSTKPLNDNANEEARQQNRRVEFYIMQTTDSSCPIPDAGP